MLEHSIYRRSLIGVIALLACLACGLTLAGDSRLPVAPVLPPGPEPFTTAYEELTAAANKFSIEYPVDGHPALDTTSGVFNVGARQSGSVWFLYAPFGAVQRTVTIPKGKALFCSMLGAESSSLEDPPFFGATEEEQAAIARYFADHIVVDSLFLIVDGVSVNNLGDYRFLAPQIEFDAPTPWIFGAIGGHGTSVADGYGVLVAPLRPGKHTIRWGGAFHFSVAEGDDFDADFGEDITYNITVK